MSNEANLETMSLDERARLKKQMSDQAVKLAVSKNHTRNFLDAIRNKTRAVCDIETAVRGDTLCQLALIAVQEGRKLNWDAKAENFSGDDAANARLRARPFRGDWKLPVV